MLIGITGQKRSGKDTFGGILVRKGYISHSFADPLKQATMRLFQLDYHQCYGNGKDKIDERYGVTPRYILQKLGTDIFRMAIHDEMPELKIPEGEFWTYNFLTWYEKNQHRDIVVPDVRFVNEANAIKAQGGWIIRIIRPANHDPNPSHISEIELDDIKADYTLVNDKSLLEFVQESMVMMKELNL